MKLTEDPWFVHDGPDVPSWKMQRRQTPYRVRCPACGKVARALYVGGSSPDVRCRWCNERFAPKGCTVSNAEGNR